MSGGGTVGRDVVQASGAVGVVALDDVGRVVLIKQYRHPVGTRLWELPAGLRDVDGRGPGAHRGPRAGRGGRPDGRPLRPAGRPAHLARLHRRDDPDLPGPRPVAGAGGRAARAPRRGGRPRDRLGRPGRGGRHGASAARSPTRPRSAACWPRPAPATTAGPRCARPTPRRADPLRRWGPGRRATSKPGQQGTAGGLAPTRPSA